MAKRKGSFLEETLANIFEKAGFDIRLNSKEFGFETDVIARRGKFTILIQAKQFEASDKGSAYVRDLLHQWRSKGMETGADRVLVVITGLNLSQRLFDIAKELGIYLWDSNIIHKLNMLDNRESVYRNICSLLNFGEVMKKFEEISQAGIYNDEDIEELQKKAIELGDIEFKEELAKAITQIKIRHDELARIEQEQKIKEREFQTLLEKKKKKAKIIKILKWIFIPAFILLLAYLIFININSNQEKTEHLSKNELAFMIAFFTKSPQAPTTNEFKRFNEIQEYVKSVCKTQCGNQFVRDFSGLSMKGDELLMECLCSDSNSSNINVNYYSINPKTGEVLVHNLWK